MAVALTASPVPAAGVVLDFASSVIGMILLATGLGAGVLRTIAVLRGSSTGEAEWMTALGFAGGGFMAAALLALDMVLS